MIEEIGDIQAMHPWLTNELFARVMKKVCPESSICVRKYSVKAALAKGENFASQMLRATVIYTTDANDDEHEIRFIIKTAVSDLKNLAVLKEMDLFRKEIVNFEHILPDVYKLLESVGDYTKMSAV